jgi:arginine:agmatine antiporter
MTATEAVETRAAQANGRAPMGLAGATALVSGGMIGSGIYLLPATLGPMGSISLLGWIAASAAALALAGVFAFLGRAVPGATGIAAFVEAGLGRFPAAVCAFIYWVECCVGNVALAIAVVGGVAYFAPQFASVTPRLILTLVAIWFAVGACAVGPRLVGRIEELTLLVGLAPVLFAAVAGWAWFHPAVFRANWNPSHLAPVAATWKSAMIVFWAFLGVECAAATAVVVRDPLRNVPRASLLGVLGSSLVYIAACTALMGVVPAARLAGSSAPFAEAGRVALGVGSGALIAFCGLVRTGGCLSGWVLVATETSRTAADDEVFPRGLRTRPGERASLSNLALAGGLMSFMALGTAAPSLAAQFHVLADVTVILSLAAYGLAALSLLRIAAGRFERGATVAAAVATGLLGLACAVILIAAGDKTELLWSLVPVALGAALYFARGRR